MAEFKAKSVCILGRQPALGLAELESLYGASHLKALANHALLDIPAEAINFNKLGGTIKVAKILEEIDASQWPELAKYLVKIIPEQVVKLPKGKFTLGLSAYGIKVDLKQIVAITREIKKQIRSSGRSVRIVPNKDLSLNSAQVLHNKLTRKGSWELLMINNGSQTILAQTLFVQDIVAYSARDQVRPARDSRVGMLPPKLAQIMINLAIGTPDPKKIKRWDKNDGLGIYLVLDPFCGSGVVLQEALLMGYSVYGTDLEPRLVEYTKKNIQWLVKKQPTIEGKVIIEQADATNYQWLGFSTVVSETYLGRPLVKLPDESALTKIINDTNSIIKKFLINLRPQITSPKQKICLAVPAWRKPNGELIDLPLLAKLTDMGYNYLDLKRVRREELVYFRENQIVARRLLRLVKAE